MPVHWLVLIMELPLVFYGLPMMMEKILRLSVTKQDPCVKVLGSVCLRCSRRNIPVKLAVDSAAGHLMQKGMVNKVVVGADRVAKGGVANKIGSLMVALAAKRFNVPFYVAAPESTFDSENSIYDVEIEERDADEVIYFGNSRSSS
jgi:methylthioribose-1-phosphate isomerase